MTQPDPKRRFDAGSLLRHDRDAALRQWEEMDEKRAKRDSLEQGHRGRGDHMNPTPLGDVVYRAQRLLDTLFDECLNEQRQARWPRAGQHQAAIGTHNPSDKTAQTAIHPDPVNTQRADRIERTLRRVCRDLEDEHAAGQRKNQRCQTENCSDVASRKGLCSACYEWQRRHGVPRRVRAAWKARA